jgi:predicted NUDIX family NTP pyrophosphohydrolase
MSLSNEDEELLDFDFDIEAEVKETIIAVDTTSKSIEKADTKTDKLVGKLDKISQNFDIAETNISNMTTDITEQVGDVKHLPSLETSDIFQLDMLQQDFMNVRATLLDTVSKGKMVIDALTNEIVINPTDGELIGSYSQLISVVNSSMKLLNSSYKDISDIVTKVKKLENDTKNSMGGDNNGVTNIQNNFYAENLNDIIRKIKN